MSSGAYLDIEYLDRAEDPYAVLVVAGAVDGFTLPRFDAVLWLALQRCAVLVLDLSRVTVLALAALVALDRRLDQLCAAGGELHLVCPTGGLVRSTLDVWLPAVPCAVYADRGDALVVLGERHRPGRSESTNST